MEKITEINCKTGEVVERDETTEEIAVRELAAQQEVDAWAARESALAKLQVLGLTEEEVQALLG